MTKDDWYFLASTVLALIGLLGIDWSLVRGRVSVSNQKRQIFLLIMIAGSLVASAIGWYHSLHRPTELSVTISAYAPVYPSPLHVVKDQVFEKTDVPLDGYDYDHDTFIDVCFLYLGGSYELQNVTLKEHWRICSSDDRLNNYSALSSAFHLYDSRVEQSSRSIIKPR